MGSQPLCSSGRGGGGVFFPGTWSWPFTQLSPGPPGLRVKKDLERSLCPPPWLQEGPEPQSSHSDMFTNSFASPSPSASSVPGAGSFTQCQHLKSSQNHWRRVLLLAVDLSEDPVQPSAPLGLPLTRPRGLVSLSFGATTAPHIMAQVLTAFISPASGDVSSWVSHRCQTGPQTTGGEDSEAWGPALALLCGLEFNFLICNTVPGNTLLMGLCDGKIRRCI